MPSEEQSIQEILANIQANMATKSDVTSIQSDIASIKTEITSVKIDISSMQGQIQSLDGQMQSLRGQVQSLDGRLNSVDDRLESFATKDDLESFATKDDIASIHSRLESFATKDDMEELFSAIKVDLDQTATKADLTHSTQILQTDIRKTEHTILDKSDDKLNDLRGDLIATLRKGNQKLVALIEVLAQKNGLNQAETQKLLSLQPFPQT